METVPADGLIAASWLLIALPLAGAAVLLLGGRRTDRWGHLLGTGTVVAAFVLGLLCTLQLGGRRVDVELFTFVATGSLDVQAGLLFDPLSELFVLLITAAVGAMVLAHIEREPGTRRTQKELSRARFLTDRPQTLPGPGVFARGNSVAAPALLPDGRLAEDSFATGIEPQEVEQMPRPTGRAELGTPDAALGTLDPAPSDIPGGRDR